ncbi:MAG TPA: amidohydrolase family protein [Alphaproteobacteria bacterium]|jgi:predicted TIM-barrel fold metal-dependent hydrolase
MFKLIAAAVLAAFFAATAHAETPVAVDIPRAMLQAGWQARIQSFLDRDVTPIIDLESSLPRAEGTRYLADFLPLMDRLGIALVAFDGYQAPQDGSNGYRWGYYIHEIVKAHPGRFILATNGGTNPNWLQQKGGKPSDFIDQTEAQARSGTYPIMGEFDVRHYLSGHQCKANQEERDADLPLDGPNGRRLFKLSAETGIAFVIHLEPEDASLTALEKMLAAYPDAKVIVAHFGQLRFPEKQRQFKPEYVRHMLSSYPNLHYDLSTGNPGRTYECNGGRFDTVIWDNEGGRQVDRLTPDYRAILTDFSTRFVAGTDYGGGRSPLTQFMNDQISNLRLILRDLPPEAQQDIAWRNAWRLLTGNDWAAP